MEERPKDFRQRRLVSISFFCQGKSALVAPANFTTLSYAKSLPSNARTFNDDLAMLLVYTADTTTLSVQFPSCGALQYDLPKFLARSLTGL